MNAIEILSVNGVKILNMKSFRKFWLKLTKFGQKMPFFTKMRFIQNYIMRYNLSYNEARDMKFRECMQKKITKNL